MPTAPTMPRTVRRARAEAHWLASGLPVQLFRLAGIYGPGPGRSALAAVRAGTARRIVKPGQVFCRIHVDDIVQVLRASMARPNPGAVYNVADDEPAPPQDVVTFACQLLGRRTAARDRRSMPPSCRRWRAASTATAAASATRGSRRSWASACATRLPRGPARPARTRRPQAESRASAAVIRARSGSLDRRWSPALISSIVTSWDCSRSARRSAVCQGTSGSRWPCSRCTGQSIGDRAAQQEVAAAVLDQRRGHRIGRAVGRRLHPKALALERQALRLGWPRGSRRSSVKSGAAAMPSSAGDALGPRERCQQHDPAAHARADQDERPVGHPSTIASASSAQRRSCRPRSCRTMRRGRCSRSAEAAALRAAAAPPAPAPWCRSCRRCSRRRTAPPGPRPRRGGRPAGDPARSRGSEAQAKGAIRLCGPGGFMLAASPR